jgi:hypothetical protein
MAPADSSSFIPAGWHVVTPRIVVHGARQLVAFVNHVFDAVGDYLPDRPAVGLGGCALALGVPLPFPTPTYYASSAYTCGPGATASLSFSSAYAYDASNFNMIRLDLFGTAGEVGGSQHFYSSYCVYGLPGEADFCSSSDYGAVRGTVEVTPEPVTIVLLGTGLLGIGGARWRRRKKDQNIDA